MAKDKNRKQDAAPSKKETATPTPVNPPPSPKEVKKAEKARAEAARPLIDGTLLALRSLIGDASNMKPEKAVTFLVKQAKKLDIHHAGIEIALDALGYGIRAKHAEELRRALKDADL